MGNPGQIQRWANSLPEGLINPENSTHWPSVEPPEGLTSEEYRAWIEALPVGVTVDGASSKYGRYVSEEVERNKSKHEKEKKDQEAAFEEPKEKLNDKLYEWTGPLGFALFHLIWKLKGLLFWGSIGIYIGYLIWK